MRLNIAPTCAMIGAILGTQLTISNHTNPKPIEIIKL